MEIVNGYICRNCADVSMAKKNIDPDNPQAQQIEAAQRAQALREQRREPRPIEGLGRVADIRV